MSTGKKVAIAAVVVAGLTALGLFLPDMAQSEDTEKTSVHEEAIVYEDATLNQETVVEERVEEEIAPEENEAEEIAVSNEEITIEETIVEETIVEQIVTVSGTDTVQESTEVITHNGYIGNIKSEKIHSPDCKNLPYEKNRVYFDTYEEGVEKGFEPCQNCNPQPR